MFSTALVSVHLRKAVRSNMIRYFFPFLFNKSLFCFQNRKTSSNASSQDASPAVSGSTGSIFFFSSCTQLIVSETWISAPKQLRGRTQLWQVPQLRWTFPHGINSSCHGLQSPGISDALIFLIISKKKSGYKCLSENLTQQQHLSTPRMERTSSHIRVHLLFFWFEHWLNLELHSYTLNWKIKGFPQQLPHVSTLKKSM